MWDGKVSRINAVQHRIELTSPDVRSIQLAPFYIGQEGREFEGDEIDRLLRMHAIEPEKNWIGSAGRVGFQEEWISTLLHRLPKTLYRQRQGGLSDSKDAQMYLLTSRCWIIFDARCGFKMLESSSRKKNIQIKWHSPRIEDSSVSSVRCFASNAPGTIQHFMDVLLATAERQIHLSYLEDIIIFLKSPWKDVKLLLQVLGLLSPTGAALKLENWFFFTYSIGYLGHILRHSKLEIAKRTFDAPCYWKNCVPWWNFDYSLLPWRFLSIHIDLPLNLLEAQQKLRKNQLPTSSDHDDEERVTLTTLQECLIFPRIFARPCAKEADTSQRLMPLTDDLEPSYFRNSRTDD